MLHPASEILPEPAPAPAERAEVGDWPDRPEAELTVETSPRSPEGTAWLARILGRFVSPWLVSMIFHLALLLALALWVWDRQHPSDYPGLIASIAREEPQLDDFLEAPSLEAAPITAPEQPVAAPSTIEATKVQLKKDLDQPTPAPPQLAPAPWAPTTAADGMQSVQGQGGGVAGRIGAARGDLLAQFGGTPGSERAVALGLAWLADHQLADGSWRLNHHLAPSCNGLCSHPGNVGSTTASTALALLPFLGAGSTPDHGEYRDVVRRGVYYLGSRMRLTANGGDLQEGTMYAQGLATIALCEAYALTGDEGLKDFCQEAIDFIVYAQHRDGGWRYVPGQAGDTTSFGWQLMALKSGQMARLRVPSPTLALASNYLDRVQYASGSNYGYQRPELDPTNSAIGLLSRMYLGWPRQNEALQRGVEYLAELGPSANNMYYNYYATQVLRHYGDPHWKPWNDILREHLIATQAQTGHEVGSWYFDEPHTKSAGRLYNTAMAVMILEVYYRHLPLYGEAVFPAEADDEGK